MWLSVRRSLRFKLFLALLLGSLTTHGAAGWAVLNRIEAGSQAEMLAQSRATAILTRELIDRRGRSLADQAQLLAMAPDVGDALSRGDRASLASLALEFPRRLDVTAVVFADPGGQTLAGFPARASPGEPLDPPEGLKRALTGMVNWSIERETAGLVLLGFAPVVRDGRPVGAIGLGDALDQRFVDRAKADTGFECSIIAPDGTPLASTLGHGLAFPVGPILPASVTVDATRGGPQELVKIEDRTFGTYASPLRGPDGQPAGYIVVGSSLDALERARREVEGVFLGIGLLVLGLNVAIAWFLARFLAVPLQQLTTAARRMASGDYSRPTNLVRDDEIGELARAFEHMRLRVGEADRLKSALISTVSHELRTPLTHIKGYSRTLLLGDWDEESRREFLQIIDEESDRLRELVDNLLDMSRIEAGVLQLDRHPLALRPFLERVIERQRAASPNYDILLTIAPDVPVVDADARRIEQVVRNLLDNAVKYSPPGSQVRVRAYPEAERPGSPEGHESGETSREPGAPAGAVVIEVEDRGIGIVPEDQPKIFERFYRVDGGLDRQSTGSGLGLSICNGIVKAHGGRIWVESTSGQGSCFRFVLPAFAPTALALAPSGETYEGHDRPRRG
jgi:signal transduction histidine kinase